MSKKKKIIVAVVVIIMLVLFFPIPIGTLDDGGSKVYSALTYKIVKWVYHNEDRSRGYRTRVYWFPDNIKDINELHEMYRADFSNN